MYAFKKIRWWTFASSWLLLSRNLLKKGLQADKINLCALISFFSHARVTSKKYPLVLNSLNDCFRFSLNWFHFKYIVSSSAISLFHHLQHSDLDLGVLIWEILSQNTLWRQRVTSNGQKTKLICQWKRKHCFLNRYMCSHPAALPAGSVGNMESLFTLLCKSSFVY